MIITQRDPTYILCRYYQLMEQLQENLEEYDKLQQLASEYNNILYSQSPLTRYIIIYSHINSRGKKPI